MKTTTKIKTNNESRKENDKLNTKQIIFIEFIWYYLK